MDTNEGGTFSSSQRESAAEIARKKVLAVYSSTLESLKQNPSNSNSPFMRTENGNQYLTPPVPGIAYSDQDDFSFRNNTSELAGNDYEQINYEAYRNEPYSSIVTQSLHQSSSSYADTTSNLKNTPINQTLVNEEWKQYHSAWQNYYQNYYNDYYSKAAQSYLATEKLRSERTASEQIRKKRKIRRLMPLFAGIFVVLFILFLQYNRLIFAPIMAYVAPNSDEVATGIEPINPTITQAVSPEPRLIIPKLNIDVPVAFGISTDEVMSAMNRGVAQFSIPGANALPGQVGNLVLSGHSAGDIYSSNPYKFIFSGLERLDNGDLIYVNYESVRYTYQMVRREVVEPTDVSALIYETDKPMITLITCTPLGTSRYRLLITGEQISPGYEAAPENPSDPEDHPVPTTPSSNDSSMPANEPSFFENIWNGIFGN